jgi:hypothetical protein
VSKRSNLRILHSFNSLSTPLGPKTTDFTVWTSVMDYLRNVPKFCWVIVPAANLAHFAERRLSAHMIRTVLPLS